MEFWINKDQNPNLINLSKTPILQYSLSINILTPVISS
ncbi:hypothetical protein D1BOALGB6SA_4951 [Olavius sp. associated proteobacterium Delta 1]|nr:hypothetical protein D1BOALGB6SA_4951 [Olavius sp. associated proteobacterium Delta 1]